MGRLFKGSSNLNHCLAIVPNTFELKDEHPLRFRLRLNNRPYVLLAVILHFGKLLGQTLIITNYKFTGNNQKI